MKLLAYLIGLIGVVVLLLWLALGMTPQSQWLWVKGHIQSTSNTVSERISETTSSADKLKNVLKERYDEASEVYHGQDPNDPLYQQMDEASK